VPVTWNRLLGTVGLALRMTLEPASVRFCRTNGVGARISAPAAAAGAASSQSSATRLDTWLMLVGMICSGPKLAGPTPPGALSDRVPPSRVRKPARSPGDAGRVVPKSSVLLRRLPSRAFRRRSRLDSRLKMVRHREDFLRPEPGIGRARRPGRALGNWPRFFISLAMTPGMMNSRMPASS